MAKTSKLVTFIILLALVLSLGTASGKSRQAKQQQQPPKTDKPATGTNAKDQEMPTLATELVQLDAVISDKSGKLVTTLKKEDFEVLEDGRPQTLSFFAAENHTPIDDLKNLDIHKRGESLDKQGTPSTIDSGRIILIVFDNLHMSSVTAMQARDALLKFVDDNVLDGDRAAILATGGGYGILQQLTGDKTVMKSAISRLSSRSVTASEDSQQPRLTEYHAQLIQGGDREALDAAIKATIRAEHLDGLPNPEQIAYSIVQGRVSRIMGQSRTYGLASLDTLQNAIKAMKNIKGRKMAVFVSDGFPIQVNELMSKVMDIADAATKAGVVIYSLDSRGLYTVIPGGDASQGSSVYDISTVQEFQTIERNGYEVAKDVMNAVARDTGGFPIFNSNNLQAGFKKSLDDNNAYYILAYYPSNTKADGKFREIKIVIKSHPELSIRTRKGYYAPGKRDLVAENTKSSQKTQANVAPATLEGTDEKADKAVRDSLSSPVPATDIGLKLSLNYIDLPAKGGLTVLDLLVEPQNLQFGKTDVAELDKEFAKKKANDANSMDQLLNPSTQKAQVPTKDERYASTLDLYVLAFGADGKLASNFKKSIQMKLYQNTYDFVNSNGLFYHDMLSLQPGLYQVRLAARQRETGMIGTTSEWIEVPDLSQKKLTLSSVFIRPLPPADPDDEEANKKQAAAQQQYVFSDFTNQAYRLIPEGSQIDMYSVIYNAQAANGKPDLVIQAQILRDNIVVYGTPLRPITDPGPDVARIPYGLRLSLKDLKPGKYQLQYSVIDRVAKTNTTRSVGIEIEE